MLLHDVIAMAAHKSPDRTAVRWPGGRRTFAELDGDVRRLAAAIRAEIEPGQRVAMLAENIPEYVAAYYGVPAGGGVLTFLNYRLHPREWAWIMNNAAASVLLVQAKYHGVIEPFLHEVADLGLVVVIDDGTERDPSVASFESFVATGDTDRTDTDSTDADRTDIDEREVAWLLYTSGTTGFPKGAMLSHRNVLAAAVGLLSESEPRDAEQSLVAFPLCHVAGYTVLVTHLRRGAAILAPSFEPGNWMDLVDEFGVTSTSLAPTMLDMILRHPDLDRHRLDSLETIGYGASAMPVELLQRAIDRFGPILQSGFGMTELSGNVLVFRKEHHARAIAGEAGLLASCGVPMALADVKVVDDDLNEVATGEVGEIVARADQVLTGYFGNEAATAEAITDGWFRTGDLARRDGEGFFYIVDRKKDMILSGGENVYCREVEEALHPHPDIVDVAVIGTPDPTWGEIVTAVVVRAAGSDLDAAAVTEFARGRLGGYKRPRRVVFVDELPRNATGKTIKRQLRELLADDEPKEHP